MFLKRTKTNVRLGATGGSILYKSDEVKRLKIKYLFASLKIANSNVVPTSRGFRWYPYFGAQE